MLPSRTVENGMQTLLGAFSWRAAACAAALMIPSVAPGLQVTGYTTTANDLFSSGFPTSPVLNGNGAFVGAGLDWSGFAWSTTSYEPGPRYKNFTLLSPAHFLTAQHFEYGSEATQGVRVLGQNLTVSSQSATSVSNLGQGLVLTNLGNTNYDLAIGNLSTDLSAPNNLARYAVLDLNSTSSANSLSAYNGLSVLLTGRSSTTNGSPRVGAATIDLMAAFNSDPNQVAFRTTRTQVQLEGGDSGSAAFHRWTNPNGTQELTVLGTNSAIDATYNYVSFLGTVAAINAANAVMTQSGYALRVAGNATAGWTGDGSGSPTSKNDLFQSSNWSGTAPSDRYVVFDATVSPSFLNIDVESSGTIRGLYFKSTVSASDGFTFGDVNTLSIGRGGITNYDNSRQVFNANLALADHQYWDGGTGGITVANLNTDGRLLEISGAGTNRITGNVSGNGSVAVSSGRLEMDGNSSYTGKTWIHGGTLRVNGNISSSSEVSLGVAGQLYGHGRVSELTGSGSVNPGNSPGILTATSVDPSGGLDFNFEFNQTESPFYNSASASGNDVLRLTDATPFSSALSSQNVINIYLGVGTIDLNDTFRGGFFTDTNLSFFSSLSNASFVYYQVNVSGPVVYNSVNYSVYSGPYSFQVSTVAETANFASGSVNGFVMQLQAIPEPSAAWLVGIGLAGVLVMAFRRGRV